MHGSSSVPQEWLRDHQREYGGEIPETYGVPVEEIREGIRNGVRKVNIDTDIRLAMTGAMRAAMAEDPREFDPRAFLKAARTATADAVPRSATRRSARRGWRAGSRRSRWRRWRSGTRARAGRPRAAECYADVGR